MLLFVLSG